MNTTHLKNYAPQARQDFVAAVTARAAKFGITADHIEPIIEQGDVALIGDKAYPRSVAENRRKLEARIDQLDNDIAATSSTAHRKKLEKERDKLAKQRVELQGFDEKLRHYADQRISLDLDDGVKVNYGKFGDLLAEVRAVHGKLA